MFNTEPYIDYITKALMPNMGKLPSKYWSWDTNIP